MKKKSLAFAVIICVMLFGALFYRNLWENKGFERTEFLFDTQCTVKAYGDNAQKAVEAAFDRLYEIHRATDFFSEDSQVATINNAAQGEAVIVEPHVQNIITAALDVSKASLGAFDITVAPLVSLWDFSGEGRVPKETEISDALAYTGIDKISFDEKNKVRKAFKEVKIDLGGAAKGYAADEAIRVLTEYGVLGAIVDLGGNISCMGQNPNTKDGKWRIGLQKPFSATGEYDEIIEIKSGAVVTSGTYQRYFEKDGKKYHHIIDPKTGHPAEREYSSVTIVAQNSLYADCLATACFVMGEEDGRALAENFGAEIYFK